MSLLRIIKCDRPGCNDHTTEVAENTGFQNWGHLAGVVNDETGSERLHLCPVCKKEVLAYILKGK